MKIKTVCFDINDAAKFDAQINMALEEGWSIVRREILLPQIEGALPLLYAELDKTNDRNIGIFAEEDSYENVLG